MMNLCFKIAITSFYFVSLIEYTTNAFSLYYSSSNGNPNSLKKYITTASSSSSLFSSAPSDVDDISTRDFLNNDDSEDTSPERLQLKQKLINLCASYDRGFGATPKALNEVNGIIKQLEDMNPTPMNAAMGISGGPLPPGEVSPPLKGIWRMIWTTALDVLNLAASPVSMPAAIHQVIDPPIATNIIDFLPRAQAALPTSFPSSIIRAEVKTRTSNRQNMSNRVGLTFEAVKLKPVQILGMEVPSNIPPFGFNLPRIDMSTIPGADPSSSPGFFDVTYLDDDMLIIRQNAPGGYFVSLRVPDCDP